jgi:hypothetical protein
LLGFAEAQGHRAHILEGEIVAGHGADPRQPASEGVDGEAEEGQQVSHFLAFEEATEVQHRDAACLERGGDLA